MSLRSGVTCLLKALLAFSFRAACVYSQSSDSPGLKIRMTEQAFNTFIDTLFMDEAFATDNQIQMPDESDSVKTPIGTVYYNITDLRVTGFVKPAYKVAITAGRLNVTLWNISFTIQGNWNYDYSRLNFSDSGDVNISVTIHSLNISIVATLDPPPPARPSLSVDHCSNIIADVKMGLGGGASWFHYLFFGGAFLESVGRKAQAKMCGVVKSFFEAETSALVASHPLQRDIGGGGVDGLAIDLRPVGVPEFGDGYVEFLLNGTVYDKDDPKKFPMQAGQFPEYSESSKNDPISILISENVLSSYAHAFFGRRNFLQHSSISRSFLPPSMDSFLSTTCSAGTFCVGKASPQISAQFPDADLEFREIFIYPPRVIVSTTGVQMASTADVGIKARLPNASLVPVFDVRLNFTSSAAVSFDNESKGKGKRRRLMVDVTELLTDVAMVANSTVDKISTEVLSDAFDSLTEQYLMPNLKIATKDGFPIPLPESIQLKNPALSVLDNCLLFTTDIEGSSP